MAVQKGFMQLLRPGLGEFSYRDFVLFPAASQGAPAKCQRL